MRAFTYESGYFVVTGLYAGGQIRKKFGLIMVHVLI